MAHSLSGFGRGVALCLAVVALSPTPNAQNEAAPSGPELRDAELRDAVRRDAARFALASYAACVEHADEVRDAVAALVATPSTRTLAGARQAWLDARDVYGTTEVLRFSDGPIDDRQRGVETFVNAWPIDESYIDYVEGQPGSGIVHDAEHFPHLTTTGLQLANERGGEENVSIGWHAIEFLLWGQDLSQDGPGQRPFTDFVVGESPGAQRRREYLVLVCDLLVQHLEQVRDQWLPDVTDNYRARFEELPADEALRRMLKGMVVLAGFEMSGERMAVAYETRDQEDEHSCFSDNTHRDFIANQRGLLTLYRGTGPGMKGFGLQRVARELDRASADEIDRLLDLATERLDRMPVPFDTLLRAADDSDERAAFLATIETLEQQAEALAVLGLELGFEIPMTPGQ